MRKILAVLTAAVLCMAVGCSGQGAANGGQKSAGEVKHYSMGTSTSGGSYYIWGGGWSKIMNENMDGMDISVEVTGGPQTNIQLIEQGEAELGFSTTWTAGDAWNGIADWTEGKSYQEMRAVFPMYSSCLYIVALKDSGITKISDLNGKNIGLGSPGATSDLAGRAVIEALGLKPKQVTSLTADTQKNSLKDGTVDVIFVVNGVPSSTVMDLETTHDLIYLEFNEEEMKTIQEQYPFWSVDAISPGTYKNQDKELHMISFWNICIVDKDVPADVVYEMTKLTYDKHADLVAVDKSAETCVAENIKYAVIPLHEGAYRYYQEMGVEVPDAAKPQ